MKKIPLLFWLFIFWTFFQNVKAQLTINAGGGVPGVNAATVIQQLVGQGVSISNVSLDGDSNKPAYGSFKRGTTVPTGFTQLPLDSGLVLTTGRAIDAFNIGNPNGTFFANTNWQTVSGLSSTDPELNAILAAAGLTGTTRDRCVIEFDIRPIGDRIFFKYTVASEEYQQFTNFADVFAFLITGPNPVTGQPAYNKRNIALIPSTTNPVSIGSVNHTQNTIYYTSNASVSTANTSNSLGPYAISYGGFTKNLVAEIAVVPCQTYRLSLRIADYNDNIYDSAVFVEQINSNVPTISGNLAPSLGGIMEGCARIPMTVNRAFTNSAEIFQIQQGTLGAGVAEFGVDYDIEFNGTDITSLPLPINFAIGESTKTFFVKPKNDALVEGTETFMLRLMTNCTPSLQISSTSGSILDATNLQPINSVPIVTGPSLIYRCKNTDVVTFTARDAETYTWTSTDGTFTCLTADCKQIRAETINTEATYNVALKIGTCTFNQSVKVIPSFLSVTPTTLTPLCLNQTQQVTASGMDSYTWSPATNLSCNNCPNPTFTAASAGNFTYTLTGTKGTCTNTQNITFTVVPQTAPTYTLADKYCVNATPVPLVGNPTGGTFTINGNPATEFNPNSLGVGNHNVSYVLGGAGCTQATNKTVEVVALPTLAWGATWKTSYCVSEPSFNLAGTATSTGGTFNVNGAIATSFNPNTLGAGNHVVTYSYTDPVTNCNNVITRNITINALPTLDITGLNNIYCVTASPTTLTGTPAGGTFTINGTSATQFNPTNLGVGNHSVVYTYTDANTCTNTKTQNVQVISLPTLTNNVKESYCLSSPSFTMTGTPGGTFTINGTPATQFNPATLGLGTYTVIQTYNDPASGCSNTLSKTVVINVKPALNFVGLNNTYCVNNSSFNLNATPAGGTFTINGTAATQFSPTTLGVGNHTIKYNYVSPTDAGCFNEITQVVEVKPLPILTFVSLNDIYCVSATTINLNATPTGGTFTINGTAATQFNASTLGVGNYTIVYSFTDNNNCTNSINKNVQVVPLPTLTNNVKTSYCLSSPSFAMTGTPGGTFTINGTPATNFDPAALGLGTYNVVQSFTDANGCSNTLSKTVTINTKPTLSFVGLNPEYCINASSVTLQATPAGGTFTINGTAATQFNPTTLGAGDYTIKYNYTDPTDAGCFNDITQIVKVNPLPQLEFTNVNNSYCVTNTSTITPSVKITLANGTIQTQNLASFVPSVVGVGTQTLTFTFTDPNTNCQNSITKNVIINPLPTLNFVNVPDEYCSEASPLTMQAAPAGGTFTINGTSTNILNPTLYAVGDILNVVYNYTDSNGCSNSISTNVEIVIPSGFTTTQQEIKICPPPTGYRIEALTQAEEDALTGAGNILTYVWSNNAPNIRFFTIRGDGDAGTYEVEVRTQAGCPIKKIKFKVEVSCEPKLFMPTAFSPNGDGLNDTWKIFGADFSQLDLRVYNRWGEAVFITYDKGGEWDGTYNGMPLPTGTYWWKAQYENVLQKGQKIVKQGMVSIVR